MNIFTTASKNLLRYKRRTTVTAAAIALGVVFVLFIDAFLFGQDESEKANVIAYETSGAKIYAEGYFAERQAHPTDILIEAKEAKSIEGFLDNTNVSSLYTPRYVSTGEIIFKEDFFEVGGSLNGILYGVDPIKDAEVYRTASQVREGEWLTRNPANTSAEVNFAEGLVMGSWLAEAMNAKIGYYVTIICKGRGGFVQAWDVPITGIVQTESSALNTSAVFMDIAYLDYMLELNGAVTEYSIDLGNLTVIDSQYEKLASFSENLPKGIELYSWRDLPPDSLVVDGNSMLSTMMTFMICLIAAIGITNTILMAVMERKNEIAMLRSLGYAGGYIKRLFSAEGLCIGLLGVIAGVLLSIPIIYFMVETGVNMTAIEAGYPTSTIIRSAWHLQSYIIIPIGTLAISALSAWIPSGSLLRQEIATIFRKV